MLVSHWLTFSGSCATGLYTSLLLFWCWREGLLKGRIWSPFLFSVPSLQTCVGQLGGGEPILWVELNCSEITLSLSFRAASSLAETHGQRNTVSPQHIISYQLWIVEKTHVASQSHHRIIYPSYLWSRPLRERSVTIGWLYQVTVLNRNTCIMYYQVTQNKLKTFKSY